MPKLYPVQTQQKSNISTISLFNTPSPKVSEKTNHLGITEYIEAKRLISGIQYGFKLYDEQNMGLAVFLHVK